MDLRTRTLALTMVLALALAVVGCGGGEGETAKPSSGEPVAVEVGIVPITALAPLYLGAEKGFFRKEGLKISPHVAAGGAAIVPAVVSGDFQFGFANNVSLLLATRKGLDLRIVAEAAQAPPCGSGAGKRPREGIVVPADGPIRDAKDLEGKTIAVNTLENVAEVVIKASLEKRGADISTLKFSEVALPDTVSAVQGGRVDAGFVVEPFLSQATEASLRVIANPFCETAERIGTGGLSTSTYFASDRYAKEHPEIVAAFTAAMKRSLAYARDHPDQVRRIVTTYTKIPSATAHKMALPTFTPELNTASIEATAKLMERYGLVEQQPNLDQLLPSRG